MSEGACSVSQVMECTGAGTRCGSCRSTIAELVGERDGASTPRRLVMAPVSSAA
ncbi:(2Fe-2S)-binding protein [Sorangium sp. So ce693]|uniref:(2Fe-2S)-binding protein n=1 Tax=Sorangium atrum TaxID=2995308 RepID=A0ABT5CBM4_9BACT|nr:(2Fe-2S)-binding protein [Sorangium aterium]MDC0683189.1 (2Fe-2S)-binding protein [Sorangium aterium]